MGNQIVALFNDEVDDVQSLNLPNTLGDDGILRWSLDQNNKWNAVGFPIDIYMVFYFHSTIEVYNVCDFLTSAGHPTKPRIGVPPFQRGPTFTTYWKWPVWGCVRAVTGSGCATWSPGRSSGPLRHWIRWSGRWSRDSCEEVKDPLKVFSVLLTNVLLLEFCLLQFSISVLHSLVFKSV